VITPLFNAEDHVAESLRSSLQQTFSDLEVIVVDDGSTDASLEVVKGFRDFRLKVIRQSNAGVSAARNHGLAEARGELVAFLDADDTWAPTCLEKLCRALDIEKGAVLAYCGWQNVGAAGARGRPYIPPDYERGSKNEVLLRECPWPIHAALTRRAAVVDAGGFDERLTNAEDYLLWLEIAFGGRIVRVPEVLAYYHFHNGLRASHEVARSARQNLWVKQEFLRRHPDVKESLGHRRIRELTLGMTLTSGYDCYWRRDLLNARLIFRMVMRRGYGVRGDWKYMLPALLPAWIHIRLLNRFGRQRKQDPV
jgi:glycosyltransferase involved in cell wall biosynthesis